MDIVYYPHQLEIALSEQCNLKCFYCRNLKEDYRQIRTNILTKAIGEFLATSQSAKNISFATGEPLCAFPLMQNALKTFSCLKTHKPRFFVTTNGTLLTKYKTHFIQAYQAGLTVSIDGDRASHDRMRIFKRGSASTHSQVIKNTKEISSPGFHALLTFTPKTIFRLFQNILYLVAHNASSFDFFPDMFAQWDNTLFVEVERQYRLFTEWYIHECISGKKSARWGYESYVKNRCRGCSKVFCGTNGVFYACEKVVLLPSRDRTAFSIGNVRTGIDLNKRSVLLRSLYNEFHKTTLFQCKRCKKRSICFCPIGLFIYCKVYRKNFKKYFPAFCRLSRIALDHAQMVSAFTKENKVKNSFSPLES